LRFKELGAALSSDYDSPPLFSPEIYVFDVYPGVPSTALRRLRPNSKVVVINRDLVIRIVLDRCARERRLQRLAAEQAPEPRARLDYCILTSPRAGGRVLGYLLRGAGIGDPAAHYREPLAASLREGFGFDDVMEPICAQARVNGIFGTRMNSQFIESSMRNRLIEFAAWLEYRKVKCIRIRRELTEQAISLHFAAKTGVWEAWEPPVEDFGADVQCDREQLGSQIRHVAKLDALIDQILVLSPKAEVLTIDYSELCNRARLLERICAFMGLTNSRRVDARLPVRISESNLFMRRALQDMLTMRADDVLAV
jgi:LPS sulfotransferase NodH